MRQVPYQPVQKVTGITVLIDMVMLTYLTIIPLSDHKAGRTVKAEAFPDTRAIPARIAARRDHSNSHTGRHTGLSAGVTLRAVVNSFPARTPVMQVRYKIVRLAIAELRPSGR